MCPVTNCNFRAVRNRFVYFLFSRLSILFYLFIYKSCLPKLREIRFSTFSKHDLYKWSRFSLGNQMTPNDKILHLDLHLSVIFSAQSCYRGDCGRKFCVVPVTNYLIHTEFSYISLQRNNGYPGHFGKYKAIKIIHSCRFGCVSLISNIANCMFVHNTSREVAQ